MSLAVARWCLARAFVAGLILLLAHPLFAAQMLSPVTDDLGVVKIPKGAPIVIGGYWVISGADTAMGIDSKRGAELAFRNIGGKLLGHPIRLTVEDDLCSAEGGQTMGKGYPAFVAEYKKVYGESPISGYHANAYDAAEMAVKAITKVAKTDKDGNLYIGKKAFHDAVFAVKFDGLSGPIGCDTHGQCAKFKPAVYEFVSADPKTFSMGKDPKKVWP
jgi:ABC-type branched-subunit amino acid transport system substrate-binding protein